MIDMERIRRLNNYDTDSLVRVLELNEDRLYHWLVLGSATIVNENLDDSIEYVKPLRKMVRSERPRLREPPSSLAAHLTQNTDMEPLSNLPDSGMFRFCLFTRTQKSQNEKELHELAVRTTSSLFQVRICLR